MHHVVTRSEKGGGEARKAGDVCGMLLDAGDVSRDVERGMFGDVSGVRGDVVGDVRGDVEGMLPGMLLGMLIYRHLGGPPPKKKKVAHPLYFEGFMHDF